MTIAFFDRLEEIRVLLPQEIIFREKIKVQRYTQRLIRNLLAIQHAYWKQRYTQRQIQCGNENTKFFHAMATERYRRNTISQVVDGSGRMVTDHNEKSALFIRNSKIGWVLLWTFLCNLIYTSSCMPTIILNTSFFPSAIRKLMNSFLTFPMTRLLVRMVLTQLFSRKPGI